MDSWKRSGSQMGVEWASDGCQMGIRWISDRCRNCHSSVHKTHARCRMDVRLVSDGCGIRYQIVMDAWKIVEAGASPNMRPGTQLPDGRSWEEKRRRNDVSCDQMGVGWCLGCEETAAVHDPVVGVDALIVQDKVRVDRERSVISH